VTVKGTVTELSSRFRFRFRFRLLTLACALMVVPLRTQAGAQDPNLPTIRRTEYGVPHILARDFRALGIGLGYAQVEDHGERVLIGLLQARGWMGRTFGRERMNSDFTARLSHQRAVETYHLLAADTRAVYEGFAEGVNIFIRTFPAQLPSWAQPLFTGHDVAALDVIDAPLAAAQRLVLRELQRDSMRPLVGPSDHDDAGSNAWALAPGRTRSGRAILLRNPHLAWTAGYWEAHVTIPGQINFYGDFRIGGPFTVIGGFNQHLGFATTNNATDTDEVYALDLHPWYPDAYMFEGRRVPLQRRDVTVEILTGTGLERATRTFWWTQFGPVAQRTRDRIYVVRAGSEGDFRAGEQFLRMMRATSLTEWKGALAMRARPTSNFTYADRAGNIFYIWNGSVPRLPHPPGGDSVSIPARNATDMWSHLVAFDSLPQLLNPPGGYLHNENDAPYYANLNAILDSLSYPPNFERPRLGLRSQHALQLIHNSRRLSLQDVIKLKHSMRMLLADRVKDDLLQAVQAAAPDAALQAAAQLLKRWDNTVAPASRGGVLFETWWRRYTAQARDSAFAEPWHPAQLTSTPRGLRQPQAAVAALSWASEETRRRFGSIDVAWGEVHRVRRGSVDVPVGGCTGALGCFRVLSYTETPDGKRTASTGDGWVLAVEFANTPRAFSVLAYGQSPDPNSPHHADQAEMFARGQMKPVRFTERDIRRALLRSYQPGENTTVRAAAR
jgi:acyl-homoserine-lactone acylase